jgi:hypothetical protein
MGDGTKYRGVKSAMDGYRVEKLKPNSKTGIYRAFVWSGSDICLREQRKSLELQGGVYESGSGERPKV